MKGSSGRGGAGSAEVLGLSGEAFALLRDLIHERAGLFYGEDRRESLGSKLGALVVDRGHASFLDYYYALKYDPASSEEWEHVFNALSVQETYFWREHDQFRALVDVVVPAHFKARPAEPLTIWSVPCATGEEPLSIAMALDQAGWWARGPITLRASDASTSAVEAARRGLYRERSLRQLPKTLLAAYFRREGDLWRVAPALHGRVAWSVLNLADERQAAPACEARVIFCRNMFIYFSRAAMQRVVDLFARRMPDPGFLFLGSSESLLTLKSPFKLREAGGAFFYAK